MLLALDAAVTIGQVGFNNPNPDPSSILDLTAVDKGLLIPRLSKPQREALAAPGRSLLVFDTTDGKFYFYDGGQWYALNEWTQIAGVGNATLSGDATVSGNISSQNAVISNSLQAASISASGTIAGNTLSTGSLVVTGTISSASLSVSGSITASNYSLNASGNGPVPSGGIIMWSGSIATIPTGWALCDGTNGTPDLTERFIIGAGSNDNLSVTGTGAYAVGSTGGANSVTLTIGQMPAHTHTFNGSGDNSVDDWTNPASKGQFRNLNDRPGTYTAGMNSTGGGLPHENRPPYYALAFIMKLP